jgi:hypothetical protein
VSVGSISCRQLDRPDKRRVLDHAVSKLEKGLTTLSIRSGVEHSFAEASAVQAVDLYHQLSTKYSCRNPQITPTGLFRLIRNQTMTLEVLRIRAGSSSGRLVGMSAWTSVDGIPTSCFGGYDVSSKDRNLYRLGWLMCYNQSIRTGMVQQHLSAGANKFKRHRGATSTMEYTAVFVDHLPLYRQWGWKIVKAVTDKVITVERAS